MDASERPGTSQSLERGLSILSSFSTGRQLVGISELSRVPVIAADGEAVAAVNLAAHRTMVSLDELVARIGPVMQRTAAEISAQLGYPSGVALSGR